jgi:hypothetical protein
MFVHRARCACPTCNYQEEVWFHKGIVSPFPAIQCAKCNCVYEASSYIISLIELYQNVTVSSNTALSNAIN